MKKNQNSGSVNVIRVFFKSDELNFKIIMYTFERNIKYLLFDAGSVDKEAMMRYLKYSTKC